LAASFFHVASCESGEGRLLLRADVEEIEQSRIRALPPERLIAWNRHARFTVHSGRTPWKTLLNGFTLVRQDRSDGAPGGLLLVSSEDAGSSLGSIRFVRRIFLRDILSVGRGLAPVPCSSRGNRQIEGG
jgi:hypothetical protein